MMIPGPKPMEMKGNQAENWKFFKTSWNNYMIAAGLDEKPPNVQLATLYTFMGKEACQLAEHLPIAEPDDPNSVLEALTQHFEPKRNTIFERYIFNSATQEEGEHLEQFLARLRKLAATCDYGNLSDQLIRDRLVIGIQDNSVRKRLLREKNLTLDTATDIIRAAEVSMSQIKRIDGEVENVHMVKKKRKPRTQPKKTLTDQNRQPEKSKQTCKYCLGEHGPKSCPAYGKECNKCHKLNHFAKACQTKMTQPQKNSQKKIHVIDERNEITDEEEISDSEEQKCRQPLYSLKGIEKYSVKLKARSNKAEPWKSIKVQIDSGSAVNCISIEDARRFQQTLHKSTTSLTAFGGQKIKPIGKMNLDINTESKMMKTVTFQVIKDAPCNLLSGPTAEQLGFISFNLRTQVNVVSSATELTQEKMLEEFKDVFTGLGDIGEYNIQLKKDASPKQDAPRTVPASFIDELKEKLKQMEKEGILEKVNEPTEWVSSAVYVKKPGKLRVCLDPQELNKYINIPKYRLPTMEDITSDMKKVKIFSVMDAKDGFLQVRLTPESAKLTTFHTPFGRYKWKRMPFGISSAPEEFQRQLQDIIEGLEGIKIIADDILIIGQGDTEEDAIQDHDRNLIKLLIRCRERNLKLNKSKIRFKHKSVKFNGHILTPEGLKPDPEKINAIKEMPAPKDRSEVKRFLGMVTYLSKFLPKLSDVSKPLRELTKEKNQFVWAKQHERSFQQLKELIMKPPTLRYHDVDEEITIETDASKDGLGAVLTQQGQPIAFASRTLTETEQRYSQIEKECLGLVFGCMKFDQYLHGREFITALTDHKPLETILSKPINVAPKRLQRMMLRLQKYRIKVMYKKGKLMYISDHLSRSPLPRSVKETQEDFDIFAIDVEEMDQDIYHNVTDGTLRRVADATREDSIISKLREITANGWPDDKSKVPMEVQEYWPYRDELTVQNGIVYRGTRVVIPTIMRNEMLKKIHQSHRGIDGCLKAAKDTLYWPSIYNDIKYIVDNCSTCQETKPAQQKQPMRSQPIPTRRWQIVSTDLFSIRKDTYLIIVDNLTKYWDVEELTELTAEETIHQTKRIFSRYGIPEVVISDNGPQFACQEYRKFASQWGFIHHTSSPHYPKGNGTAEAAVKQAKKIFKKSEDPWLAVLENRNIPDQLASPNEKLISRRTRSTIPTHPDLLKPKVVPIKEIIDGSVEKKRENKKYYDRRSKQLPPLVVGDHIRAKIRPQSSQLWSQGEVTKINNDQSCNVKVDGREYRRNRIHIRKSGELIMKKEPTYEYQDVEIQPPKRTPEKDRQSASEMVNNTERPRRSERVRKPNPKYKDFVV